MSLKDKRVVVIGGSSGIGLATAQAAAAQGAQVLIAARNEIRLQMACAVVGCNCETRILDITREEEVRTFFESVGSLDHLVTTASGSGSWPFLEIPTGAARGLFEGKFWGQYHAAKHAAKRIAGDGSITFFSGVLSHKTIPGNSTFSAINGAIESLCRALAIELSPLRVNCVSPGIMETPLYDGLSEEDRLAYFREVAQNLPVRRVGEPEDAAQTVLYLMQNGYTTGAIVEVDGGMRLV